MSVLSAAVFAKDGSLIFSRQFVDIDEARIYGILSAFPKLVNMASQHTFLEKETLRYVYQPMDTIFVVLVTLKSSNIIADVEILKLLSKVLPVYCENRMVSPESVRDAAFELIGAFDEVINLGYKEKLSLSQIEQFTLAASHEEEVQTAIRKNKERITKREMMKKSLEIGMQKARMESARAESSYDYPMQTTQAKESFGMPQAAKPPKSPRQSSHSGIGMKLSTPSAERKDPLIVIGGGSSEGKESANIAEEAARSEVHQPTSSILAKILEKISVVLNKDGGMENMEVKGDLTIQTNEEKARIVHIETEVGDTGQFEVKLNPIVNKKLYLEQGVLENRDKKRLLPLGVELSIVKWRFTTSNESNAPLLLTCWPTEMGGKVEVTLEYELNEGISELNDVVFSVPIPSGSSPVVADGYEGEYLVNSRERLLLWRIPVISEENSTSSLLFEVPSANADHFFPVNVSFVSSSTFYPIKITSARNDDGNLSWDSFSQLAVDQYTLT